MKKKQKIRAPFVVFILILVAVGAWAYANNAQSPTEISTQEGIELLQSHKVKSAKIIDDERKVELTLTDTHPSWGRKVRFTFVAARAGDIIKAVEAAKPASGYTDEVPGQSWLSSLFAILLPLSLVAFVIWIILSSSRAGGPGGGIFRFGRSRARLATKEDSKVKFADCAGVDEAIEELREIKEFLEKPDKFISMGAKVPKGVLLYGPPGTGKTLLAKAVAGEAGVAFFSTSGSDFVEMFVGVGASRVRDLFEQAKHSAPAIVFVDEIDAVGRQRGVGLGGGNDEREQTLNQLLVELDGFDEKTGVILIAATNRPDVLDKALLRPGRFDRQIGVDAPDVRGRKEILAVHAKGKPIDKDLSLESVARRTPGFTGADLANVLNEAALLAAREGKVKIADQHIDEAIDRVLAGPQKKTRRLKDKERILTAYHEAGHAIVAAGLNHSDPVTKVTILPRGRALGYTLVTPLSDHLSATRNQLLDQLAYLLGGKVTEEFVFKEPTTGASNDIEKATKLAHKMVTEYGMSATVGSVNIPDGHPASLYSQSDTYSTGPELSTQVDKEVAALIDCAMQEAWQIISQNRKILDDLVLALLEHETLHEAEIAKIFENLIKLPEREPFLSSTNRPFSTQPPIAIPTAHAQNTDKAEAEGIDISKNTGETDKLAEAPPNTQDKDVK